MAEAVAGRSSTYCGVDQLNGADPLQMALISPDAGTRSVAAFNAASRRRPGLHLSDYPWLGRIPWSPIARAATVYRPVIERPAIPPAGKAILMLLRLLGLALCKAARNPGVDLELGEDRLTTQLDGA